MRRPRRPCITHHSSSTEARSGMPDGSDAIAPMASVDAQRRLGRRAGRRAYSAPLAGLGTCAASGGTGSRTSPHCAR